MNLRLLCLLALCLTFVPSIVLAEEGSQHVLQLLLQAEGPLRGCLDREVPEGEHLPQQVQVRLEFPSAAPARVITLDAWPGSALDRCVRESISAITAPAYSGVVERHECVIPIGPGTLQCRPHQTNRQVLPAPRETPPSGEQPAEDVASPPPGDEEDSPPEFRKNSVTINPLGVIVGGADLKFTRAFTHSSLGFAVAMRFPARLDDLGVLGFIEVLGWINEVPFTGFYAGASLQAGGSFGPPDVIYVGPLAVVGLRWTLESGLTLGIGGSAGYLFYFSDCSQCLIHTITGDKRLDSDGRTSAFTARLAFDIGFAF